MYEAWVGTTPWHKWNIEHCKKVLKKQYRLDESRRNSKLIRKLEKSMTLSLEILNYVTGKESQ